MTQKRSATRTATKRGWVPGIAAEGSVSSPSALVAGGVTALFIFWALVALYLLCKKNARQARGGDAEALETNRRVHGEDFLKE
jgi:hypothetical protein